jgi:DNA mismatch endonuclease (patch repair protein)
MPDVVDKETRSRMMSGIKGKNTKPEMVVRSFLHRQGFRFRLHSKTLPGKPDIVLPKFKTVVFVHGCFWHRHLCQQFVWPKTRMAFWKEKLEGNVARDKRKQRTLRLLGWNVITLWECGISETSLKRLQRKLVALPQISNS